MLYLIIIALAILIIYIPNALVNTVQSDLPWVYYLIAIAIFVGAEFIIDALVAFVVRWIFPEKWMNPKKGIIYTPEWEIKLYTKLRVDKWKDYMPDLGRFTKFPKGNLLDPYNNDYLKKYIVEASYGVAIHFWSVPASLLAFLIMLIEPSNPTIWTVGVPVMVVNMVLIYLPAMTLKYNLPRLIRITEINDRLAAKKSDVKES